MGLSRQSIALVLTTKQQSNNTHTNTQYLTNPITQTKWLYLRKTNNRTRRGRQKDWVEYCDLNQLQSPVTSHSLLELSIYLREYCGLLLGLGVHSVPESVYPPLACRTGQTQLAASSAAGCSMDSTWRRNPCWGSTLLHVDYLCRLRSVINIVIFIQDWS